MYTKHDRELLYNRIIDFFRSAELFEGVVQIGSGTIGFRDQYSDIDLMAAYYNKDDVEKAKTAITRFFKDLSAGYINERVWTKTTLGVSVYFANGLGIDLSFGPTNELIVCSPQWKIALDKTGRLTEHMKESNGNFIRNNSNYGIDNSIHYKFMNALRRSIIATKRSNYIYALNMLNEARQYVLDIQVLNEGKKVHQFNAYHTLNSDFYTKIMRTFPMGLAEGTLEEARKQLYNLFFEVVDQNNQLKFDESVLVLLAV